MRSCCLLPKPSYPISRQSHLPLKSSFPPSPSSLVLAASSLSLQNRLIRRNPSAPKRSGFFSFGTRRHSQLFFFFLLGPLTFRRSLKRIYRAGVQVAPPLRNTKYIPSSLAPSRSRHRTAHVRNPTAAWFPKERRLGISSFARNFVSFRGAAFTRHRLTFARSPARPFLMIFRSTWLALAIVSALLLVCSHGESLAPRPWLLLSCSCSF